MLFVMILPSTGRMVPPRIQEPHDAIKTETRPYDEIPCWPLLAGLCFRKIENKTNKDNTALNVLDSITAQAAPARDPARAPAWIHKVTAEYDFRVLPNLLGFGTV